MGASLGLIFNIEYGCIDVVRFYNDNICMTMVEYDNEYTVL